MTDDTVEIELDLDEHTLGLLEAEVKRTGLTMDEVVNKALKAFIDAHKEKEDVLQ